MKTKANQSAAERNITMVALADIQPSGFNPRKRFDETSLYELAESIKRQGVLQPITVRPVDGTDRYGIVFGERRYRASVIAGRDEIPAIVTELSDEEAEEMAITENLQRKDVTPVEEAAAYQRLIESGRHTVQTLAQLFGKNENYIRTRLKFTALIPEIAALLPVPAPIGRLSFPRCAGDASRTPRCTPFRCWRVPPACACVRSQARGSPRCCSRTLP
jgi:ParB family transcriptional regulator, chromosome partitioning protein